MITFFTTTEKINVPFMNSIESWIKLPCVDKIHVHTSQKDIGISHNKIQIFDYEFYKPNEPPKVGDLFNTSMNNTENTYLCYVNSDIMFLSDFCDVFKKCQEKVKSGIFQFIGKRYDWHDWKKLNVFDLTDEQIKNIMLQEKFNIKKGNSHADYFCFHRKIYEDMQAKLKGFPPFFVARRIFDNWLSYAPRFCNYTNINVTSSLMAIHHEEKMESRKKDWSTKPFFDEQVAFNESLFEKYRPPKNGTIGGSLDKSADLYL